MRRVILTAFLFLTGVFFLTQAQAQPAQPTKDLIPRSTVKDVDRLHLPYQPRDIDDDVIIDEIGSKTQWADGDNGEEDETEKVKIDWEQIPYIPSKPPVLKPAPDPEI